MAEKGCLVAEQNINFFSLKIYKWPDKDGVQSYRVIKQQISKNVFQLEE
jgi:hypothetical protein